VFAAETGKKDLQHVKVRVSNPLRTEKFNDVDLLYLTQYPAKRSKSQG